MERTDEVGAAAAAEYFMQLFSYTFRSGEVDQWRAIGAQECSFCANVLSDVESVYRAGGSFRGGSLTLGPPTLLASDATIGVFTVGVPYDIAALDEVDAAGKTVRTIEAESGTAALDVLFGAGGWTLVGGTTAEASE
jgi:hypothetical protein